MTIEQPTFCFDEGEWTSQIEYFDYLTLIVFALTGASDHLASADKWLLHKHCILFANTS